MKYTLSTTRGIIKYEKKEMQIYFFQLLFRVITTEKKYFAFEYIWMYLRYGLQRNWKIQIIQIFPLQAYI